MRDMVRRKRSLLGEKNHKTAVPDWIVKEALKFLKTGVTQKKVAEMLNKKGWPCDKATVSKWVLGKTRGIKS